MNLTGLLTGIGQAGSDVAQGKLDADQAKLKDLFDKLGLKQGQVNLQESEERLRKLQGAPSNETEKIQQQLTALRAAAKQIGLTLTPEQEGQFLGIVPPPSKTPAITNRFEGLRAAYMREHGGQEPPTEVIQSWDKQPTEKAVKINTTKSGEPYEIVDADGKTYRYGDPNMPQAAKDALKDWENQESKGERKKAVDEARKSAELLARSMALMDAREADKERGKLIDVARRGISGHSYLQAVQQEVAAAGIGGGKGTTSGDRIISDGFMQLMFGPDAKGIRGSTQVMEIMLKQGGWDDKLIGKLNDALSGGKLSQDVRQQILETSSRQVGIWDAYVQNFGSLTDDPKSKAVLSKYWENVYKGEDATAKTLGATPK